MDVTLLKADERDMEHEWERMYDEASMTDPVAVLQLRLEMDERDRADARERMHDAAMEASMMMDPAPMSEADKRLLRDMQQERGLDEAMEASMMDEPASVTRATTLSKLEVLRAALILSRSDNSLSCYAPEGGLPPTRWTCSWSSCGAENEQQYERCVECDRFTRAADDTFVQTPLKQVRALALAFLRGSQPGVADIIASYVGNVAARHDVRPLSITDACGRWLRTPLPVLVTNANRGTLLGVRGVCEHDVQWTEDMPESRSFLRRLSDGEVVSRTTICGLSRCRAPGCDVYVCPEHTFGRLWDREYYPEYNSTNCSGCGAVFCGRHIEAMTSQCGGCENVIIWSVRVAASGADYDEYPELRNRFCFQKECAVRECDGRRGMDVYAREAARRLSETDNDSDDDGDGDNINDGVNNSNYYDRFDSESCRLNCCEACTENHNCCDDPREYA
jgi:hypothetical protein